MTEQTEADRAFIEKVKTIGMIVRKKERLPLGSGARGQYITGTDGRRDIFVPSFGSMEQEEIDYIVEGATEQEDERVKVGRVSAQKQAIGSVLSEMRKAPPGERAKTGEALIKDMRR